MFIQRNLRFLVKNVKVMVSPARAPVIDVGLKAKVLPSPTLTAKLAARALFTTARAAATIEVKRIANDERMSLKS